MSETGITSVNRRSANPEKMTTAQIFAEMDRLNEQMRQDQAEIDRLKTETRAISAHTIALLSQIEAQLDAIQQAA